MEQTTKTTAKSNKKFFVLGGKWWDKANGNTYTRAKIMDTNGQIYYTHFEYGYGNYYLQLAKEYLKNKYPNKNIIVYNIGSFYDKKSIISNGRF
jgi:hypothetical protein